ncbi:MAG: hypothetical protein IJR54_08800 [Oscillibacter sp.]|nr:hypothetical protein [Oscillibacter sp.]
MKGTLRRTLCLICALTLLFTSTNVLSALALEEANLLESADIEREYDPAVGSAGEAESGLFVITGLNESGSEPGEPTEEPAEIPDSMDKDAYSSNKETLSMSGAVSEDAAALMDGAVVTPNATPTVTVSTTQLSIKTGETSSVTVSISGYPSGAYLQSSNSNSEAASCIWGDWSGASIPLRFTGRQGGSATVTVRLKDTNNKILVSETIRVSVVQNSPTLSVSPASLSLKTGASKSSTLTIRNYSGGGSVSASVDNRSVCDVSWGSWSGWSIPITVKGKSAGSTKVTLRLYNSLRTELASVSLNVEVVPTVTLSLSSSSLTVYAGESASLTATANGTLSNGDCFKYSASNASLFSVSPNGTSSGQNIRLNVAGKNQGSGTLKVTLNSQSGEVLDSKEVSVKILTKPDSNPRVSVAPSSTTVEVGKSVKVNCTGQNISGSFSLRYVNNSPSLLSCAWKDGWSGNTVPVTITGNAAGTGSVTIELLVGSVVRSSTKIQVTVTGGSDNGSGGGNDNGGSNGKSPSYSFSNYSKPRISLALCQYMFGNTQKAKTVYNYDIGNGGVCFGMSATSGLIFAPNTPNPAAFGTGKTMSTLKKSDFSNTLQLSLSDFIEAMHITQVASMMNEQTGISNMVNAVRNGGTSQPVIICVRGPGGGHAILGYGVTSSGNIRVYDSNWPGQERTVDINGNNWSYKLWSGKVWDQSNGRISYIPYSTYSKVWQSKGTLKGATLQDGGLLNEEDSRYLLATTADDFSLMVFDENAENYEREVARYEKGVLVKHEDTIEEVFLDNVLLNSETPSHLHMLYIPGGKDLYTVYNRSGKMDVTLSGSDLSVHVNSEAEEFVLAVSDEEEFATAMLNGLAKGDDYSISVGSSRFGDPDETNIEGTGNGNPICLGLGEGALGGMDGLYISNGADGMLSLNAMEGEDSKENSPFKQDFTLNSKNLDTEYPLTAEAGEGGEILTPDGKPSGSDRTVTSVLKGDNYTYRIRPKSGYTLKAIYVNGVQAAYSQTETDQPSYSYYNGAYEYTFRDVQEVGYLYAEFSKDISACRVYTDHDNGETLVSVWDGDTELSEGLDYVWTISRAEENGEEKTYLAVQAVSGSDYTGVSMTPYDYHTQDNDPALTAGTYNPTAKEISLTAQNVDAPVIVAAAYASGTAEAGKMLAFVPETAVVKDAKTADGIPVRIPLNIAGLPEKYVVRVFLLSDTDTMRVLCAPVEVSVSP